MIFLYFLLDTLIIFLIVFIIYKYDKYKISKHELEINSFDSFKSNKIEELKIQNSNDKIDKNYIKNK